MSKSRIVKNDFSELNRMVRGLSGPKYIVKIGIMGNKSDRNNKETGSSITNAELGLIHEVGSFLRGIPARSFLQMPLHQRRAQIIRDGSAGSAARLRRGDIVGILERFGAACVGAVSDAFRSRGFGTWAPDSPETIRGKSKGKPGTKGYKIGDSPLIDTGQLQRSVTWKVEQVGSST